MRKLLFLFVFILLFCPLLACNTQSTESGNTIKVGDTVPCAYGETFEMYICDKNHVLTDEKVKITVKVILEKENSITEKSDYRDNVFLKYTYSVSISGSIDSSYSGEYVSLTIGFLNVGGPVFTVGQGIVSEDGTFNWTQELFSNGAYLEWVPYSFVV